MSKSSREHRQLYPQPGWVEHDAEEIWQNTLAVVKDVVSGSSQPIRLSITNQRETIVIFDRASGKPLHNAIVWQCRRGDNICKQLKVDHQEATVRRKTGLLIDTYFSASKLRWLIDNIPEIHQALVNGTALIGTMDTYLIYRLTEGRSFATDHTNASRTLLYDYHQLRWSDYLCDLFHVPSSSLAEIRDSNAYFGATDIAGTLKSPVPIHGVMGDSQASLFAMGCHHVGDTKVTFGTGSSLLLNVGADVPKPSEGSVGTIAWVIDGHPSYCLEGIISYSAATLQWLRNQMQLFESYDETQGFAESVVDNAGVYLVPAFAGLSAPYWAPEAKAAIVGLTTMATKAHVIRAALESIAYQVQDVLEMMRVNAGVTPRSIHADGGAAANTFLMQFTADLIDAEVRISLITESSPLGAAMCGAIGTDVASLDQLKIPGTGRVYRREVSADTAEARYAGWKRAVQSVLGAPPSQVVPNPSRGLRPTPRSNVPAPKSIPLPSS
jgi:glycerol kinase